MSDLTALSSSSPARRVTYQKVPAIPVAERRIKTIEQLPPNLRHIANTRPPYLPTKPAQELNGGGRSKLYEDAAEGRVKAIKKGASTLWETLSILLNLANAPAAVISPAPPRPPAPPRERKPKPAPVAAAPTELAPPPPELAG
jgi:hypothetical protein